MNQGYILGIGSNIDQNKNIPMILTHLIKRFGPIMISRFYETAPVGMDSNQLFINFCAFAQTSLESAPCKEACIAIEVELGRDRTHPLRKTRDRAADIDLLTFIGAHGHQVQLELIADYLSQPVAEIGAILSPRRAIIAARGCVRTFTVGGLQLGETPTAIDCNDRAGLIVVSHNRFDC